KVTTTSGRPSSRASSAALVTIRWWPRCTPSNTPMVTTEGPQASGTSPSPSQRSTMLFLTLRLPSVIGDAITPLVKPAMRGPVLGRGHVGLAGADGHLPPHVPDLGDEQDGGGEQDDEDPSGGQDGPGANGAGGRACGYGAERCQGEAAEQIVGGQPGEHGR